ncbi:MAG: DUF1289 domain-containing protein [Gammaproteobacteria bacterium]|nr:DUF1289 domain-containing protein [Gammaproteobacteria bacterium]MDH3535441.1 DUF1289 domain-containing protein [Gammaproteobacteria bacterium]
MDTETAFRVESPCVRKCTLGDDDVCVGCYRAIDEICAWGGASNARREEILLKAAQRRERNARRA